MTLASLSCGHFRTLLLCIYKLFVLQYLLEGSSSLNFPIFEALVYFKTLCYGMCLMDPQREQSKLFTLCTFSTMLFF